MSRVDKPKDKLMSEISKLGGTIVAGTLESMVTKDGIAKFVRAMKPEARKQLREELDKYV